MTDTTLPDQGVVFWPVGTGDSTTVVVDEEHVLQVPDLRPSQPHQERSLRTARRMGVPPWVDCTCRRRTRRCCSSCLRHSFRGTTTSPVLPAPALHWPTASAIFLTWP
jgi:hypothetical protein